MPGISGSPTLSAEAWLMHVPGLCWSPFDALRRQGLDQLIRRQSGHIHRAHPIWSRGEVPEESYTTLGKADVKKEGKDVTIIATMAMAHRV